MKKCLFLLLSCVILNAHARIAPLESSERFHPEVGSSVMVATQSTLATDVGLDILKQGGNAVDAATAVGFALAVVLPRAGNIGGGGFMVIWQEKSHLAYALNYREKAPEKATAAEFITAKGEVDTEKLNHSYAAPGVPGTVSGLLLAQKKFGRLTREQILAPAIRLAQQGFVVDNSFHEVVLRQRERLMQDPESRRIFFDKNGDPIAVGARFRQEDLAKSLMQIAKHGEAAFYKGDIAEKIVQAMKKNSGLMSKHDLAEYHAEFVKPLTTEYRGHRIIAMPPPSSGGVSVIEALQILSGFDIQSLGLNSAASIHLLTETLNWVYFDRNKNLGDPKYVKMPLSRLLSRHHARFIRKQIQFNHHTPASEFKEAESISHESPQTTHYSIVDKDGNMVSNTYTLNFAFGTGITVPGTGILLNNEMDDFTILADKPNAYGLRQGTNNLLAPGRQPLSSMSPIIVLNPQGHAWLATGSPGGSLIITTVIQVLLNAVDHHLNIASSVMMPRIHSQLWPDVLMIEQGISPDTRDILKRMGHQLVSVDSLIMGSAQTVAIIASQRQGVADPRRPGASARGY